MAGTVADEGGSRLHGHAQGRHGPDGVRGRTRVCGPWGALGVLGGRGQPMTETGPPCTTVHHPKQPEKGENDAELSGNDEG